MRRLIFPLVLLLLLGGVFVQTVAELPDFGDPDNPAHNYVKARYLELGPEETGSPNAVTAILFDYRAYDTFGEVTVLFTAVTAVILALRLTRKEG